MIYTEVNRKARPQVTTSLWSDYIRVNTKEKSSFCDRYKWKTGRVEKGSYFRSKVWHTLDTAGVWSCPFNADSKYEISINDSC